MFCRLKTADHNEVEVVLSYRVSFVGLERAERWFNVKDYVGLLCDHAGSLLRGAARACSIEAFYQNSTEILRTAILGEKREGEPRTGSASSRRTGCGSTTSRCST